MVFDNRTATELIAAGCICEFGCRNCGLSKAQMGNCPAWDPCPMGRAQVEGCSVHSVAV